MVAALLRGFAAREWIDELDLTPLEPCKNVFITEELRERRSDIIWRLRWRGHEQPQAAGGRRAAKPAAD